MSNVVTSSNIGVDVSPDVRDGHRRFRELLEEILPPGWTPLLELEKGPRVDAMLRIKAPSGSESSLRVLFKNRFEPRDVAYLEGFYRDRNDQLLLVASFLSPRSQELLRKARISYIDFHRNAWVSTNSLFIQLTGSMKAPQDKGDRPARSSLRGPKTARIVRYLCDFRAPLKVRDIAEHTSLNAGNVSRILELLERESIIERRRGSVSEVDWQSLIRRWAVDIEKERSSQPFLEARGLDVFNARLGQANVAYAITGSYASAQIAPAAMPVATDVYVMDVNSFAEEFNLRRSERVGNVRLIEAPDRVVFERTMNAHGLVIAGPSQIAADLLTLSKRSNDEFDALLGWMKANEYTWRQ